MEAPPPPNLFGIRPAVGGLKGTGDSGSFETSSAKTPGLFRGNKAYSTDYKQLPPDKGREEVAYSVTVVSTIVIFAVNC
jgi:hypothetical protein